MIDTIAKRRVTLNGKTYQKGDTVPMPLQQFNDLESTGRFERAPAPKSAPKRKPAPKRKVPSTPPAAAPAADDDTPFESADTAD